MDVVKTEHLTYPGRERVSILNTPLLFTICSGRHKEGAKNA